MKYTDMRYNFDIMYQDEILAEIRFMNHKVQIEKKSNSIFQFFNEKNMNIQTILYFLETRCYENEREDLKEILQKANMKSNNPWEWCKRTHGVTYEDCYWIRFENEDIKWKDVALDGKL